MRESSVKGGVLVVRTGSTITALGEADQGARYVDVGARLPRTEHLRISSRSPATA